MIRYLQPTCSDEHQNPTESQEWIQPHSRQQLAAGTNQLLPKSTDDLICGSGTSEEISTDRWRKCRLRHLVRSFCLNLLYDTVEGWRGLSTHNPSTWNKGNPKKRNSRKKEPSALNTSIIWGIWIGIMVRKGRHIPPWLRHHKRKCYVWLRCTIISDRGALENKGGPEKSTDHC